MRASDRQAFFNDGGAKAAPCCRQATKVMNLTGRGEGRGVRKGA